MAQLALPLLCLALGTLYGLSQGSLPLRTLPEDVQQVSCTGDLQCDPSADDYPLCTTGDKYPSERPVLVPTNITAETVRKYDGEKFSLCLQITIEISAAFLTESTEFGSGDCEYYYGSEYISDEEEAENEADKDVNEEDKAENKKDEEEEGGMIIEVEYEGEEPTGVNVVLRLNNSNNGSVLCAEVILSHGYDCHIMRMMLPLSTVQHLSNTSSMVVGSVIYSCIEVKPGSELHVMSYSSPRYSDALSATLEVPSCLDLTPQDNIPDCASPTLDFDATEMTIGVDNGSNNRETSVRLFYNITKNKSLSEATLVGQDRHTIAKSDIMPCMCIEAWYLNLMDPVKTVMCPFRHYPEETTLNKSKLLLTTDNMFVVYELYAACNASVEASLCWKTTGQSECREIPFTRKSIASQGKHYIKGLQLQHPSICVQASVKGRVLHTECLNVKASREFRNEVIVVSEGQRGNISVCMVEDGGCRTLSTAQQMEREATFLEQKIVDDVRDDQCVKMLSVYDREILICPLDKYMRSRWTWLRGLCLLVVACFLLLLLIKNESLKKWLKSLTADGKALGEIFQDRKVLILYSPDSPAYEELVGVFASCLKDLRLEVILDQWKRTEIAKLNPLPWYHKQKSLVLEERGSIILLFSEGARDKYVAWEQQRIQQVTNTDPYGSFGAVLNCIYPDFRDGMSKDPYLVSYFNFFGANVVPDLFSKNPIYSLPLNLEKLLLELAAGGKKKLGMVKAKRLSAKIRSSLQASMTRCRRGLNRLTVLSQTESETSELGNEIKIEMESQPLM
ncbi:interleukin-17 receptor C isoform X2 [Hyperolius riggenbachi]|uniref:interleukin-17 receptor C isoform X2 n=1 Tax=Hyperolius riggenbachi TaxID=752182 RepID=UPI0035A39354